MTTQIQKEYIKTVNCQKTSLDVLGRDSWTWTDWVKTGRDRPRQAEVGQQGHVLVTLSGQ